MPKETAPNVSPNWGVFASLGSASCWSKWVTIYTIYIHNIYIYYVDTIYIYIKIWEVLSGPFRSFQVLSGPFRSFPQMGGPYERPSFLGPLRIRVYIYTCIYICIYIYVSIYIYIHNIHIDNMCTYIHYLHIVYIYIYRMLFQYCWLHSNKTTHHQ